jgi:3-phenylpropionate/cinnamic acid dioxygenase small subunit
MHNGCFKSLKEVVHFYNTRDLLPRCAATLASILPKGQRLINLARIVKASIRHERLQSRVNWLTFERQNSEDTLMCESQWFSSDKALQSLDTQCELSARERALCPDVPRA